MADKRNHKRRTMPLKDLPHPLGEVLYEFHRVGHILRVHAIDPKTATEVIMIADPRMSMDAIKTLAARKLSYVLAKKRAKQDKSASGKSRGFNRLA